MDDLLLVYQPDGALFTGRVLLGNGGERGAAALDVFEKIPFPLMIAKLAEHVSTFAEKEEKVNVFARRSDLPNQPAFRFDEELVNLMHVDPVSVMRTLSPAPIKVFAKKNDPTASSPLRVGFDAIAATLGTSVYIRRRGDQVECPGCGRWAPIRTGTPDPQLVVSRCLSSACHATLRITCHNDRWASVRVKTLLVDPDRERFFLPREWNNPGPWVTREDLEKKYRDWLTIKEEFK